MGYADIPQTTAPRESLARKKKKLQKFWLQRWPRGVSEWCILGGAWVLHQQVPWSLIGASLDRMIHLPTQSDPGVLEMKYIHVKPGKTLSDVFLSNQSVHNNNKNHKYLYQLCHQMFSTTYKWGYFMAYGTNKEFFIGSTLKKKTGFWNPIFLKLIRIYEEVNYSLRFSQS